MDFLKFHKCWSKFCEYINPILQDINFLKLDFCRVDEFWESTTDYKKTGWIAENYLGYTRIHIVLLAHIDSILDHDTRALNEFKCMIQSSFVMISHLMTRSNVNMKVLGDIIKIFLTSCDMFDKMFGYSDVDNPFWFKKTILYPC